MRIIKLTNQIGWAVNIYGFKFPIILGYREFYFENTEYRVRNRWFQRHPAHHLTACGLSTTCTATYWYKAWRGYGHSLRESFRMAWKHSTERF